MNTQHQMRALRSLLGRAAREAILYPRILKAGSGRKVLFLPSSGREQSGLQRAYMIADELERIGWQTLVIPKHLGAGQRDRLIHLFRPDLIVVQKCRHPLNRQPYLHGKPVVLDLDDADFMDPELSGIMEEVARKSYGIICGSCFVHSWAATHNDNTCVIWTGSNVMQGPWPAHEDRARIVTWAQSNPLAQKEELAFVENVILECTKTTAPFTFRLYGWRWPHDHPRLARLRDAGVDLELVPPLPYEAFIKSLREVAVGLSAIAGNGFTQGKSFGKMLGYLDAKTPVICSDAADHGVFFEMDTGVVSNNPDVWVKELAGLLDDPDRRAHMSQAAYALYLQHLDIRAVAGKVSEFLEKTRVTTPCGRGGVNVTPR